MGDELTAGQRSALALEDGGTVGDAETRGVNHSTVRLARVVKARAPEVYERLLRGEIGVGKAYKLARDGEEPPAHPAAAIFPMMGAEDRATLKADIERHGYREDMPPVLLHRDGRIIDGRNRVSVCDELGIPYPTAVYDKPDETVLGFVLSLNLSRRQLDTTQKALVAARMANLKEGRPAKTRSQDLVSQAEAAKVMGISVESVKRADKVLKSGDKKLIDEVERGDKKVTVAARSLGTTRPRKVGTGKPAAPSGRITALPPADVRISDPRPADVCLQFSNLINRLAEIAERNDAAWLRDHYPPELVKDLDLSLGLATDFLGAVLDQHRARKNGSAGTTAEPLNLN
jgi:hypothetical protein